eukprot:1159415-Pelagomonas_calceolata.AAC.2
MQPCVQSMNRQAIAPAHGMRSACECAGTESKPTHTYSQTHAHTPTNSQQANAAVLEQPGARAQQLRGLKQQSTHSLRSHTATHTHIDWSTTIDNTCTLHERNTAHKLTLLEHPGAAELGASRTSASQPSAE